MTASAPLASLRRRRTSITNPCPNTPWKPSEPRSFTGGRSNQLACPEHCWFCFGVIDQPLASCSLPFLQECIERLAGVLRRSGRLYNGDHCTTAQRPPNAPRKSASASISAAEAGAWPSAQFAVPSGIVISVLGLPVVVLANRCNDVLRHPRPMVVSIPVNLDGLCHVATLQCGSALWEQKVAKSLSKCRALLTNKDLLDEWCRRRELNPRPTHYEDHAHLNIFNDLDRGQRIKICAAQPI